MAVARDDLATGELLAALETSPVGLSGAEAARRLARDGPNEPAAGPRFSALREVFALATSPLVLILLVASVVSAFLGDVVNAGLIAAMVGFSLLLGYLQSARSVRAAEALRALEAPAANVIRDGRPVALPHRALVAGDVVRLAAGDLVPADLRVLEAHELHVLQANLTGESLPVAKRPLAAPAGAEPLERADLLFLGTSVVSGSASAVVTATGGATAFGRIAAALAQRAPLTEFDRGTRAFGFLIMRTVFALVLLVLLVNVALKRDTFESLLFAVSLAVGLTPEFLPMITTVTLARGALGMARAGVVVKRLAAIQNLGSMDVLCSDKTNTLTSGEMRLERTAGARGDPAPEALRLARLTSAYQTGIRSPFDLAILAAEGAAPSEAAAKIDELPFDFERRRLSVVLETGGRRLLLTAGAPESLLAACALDGAERAAALATEERLSADGYRVLAIGWREIERREEYALADERGLALAGFLAFIDPPLEGAAEVVRTLREEGVALKVLTGDNDLVARHVCAALGLDVGPIALGSDVERLNDLALEALAERTTVFARVSPEQKDRIILALKRRGHVVGYLGDGVNDAPSLHVADVGISVSDGADVAKDAASIILREGRLDVLREGILGGRRAYGNVMKYLLMGTSSNFGNMLSMAVGSAFLPFLPMLPRQILLNNFLYDVAQVTIPTDNVDPSFVLRPRRWDIRVVTSFMLRIGPLSSIYDFLTFGVMLWVFGADEPLFRSGWFVESLATQTLVLLVIRTQGVPWRSRPSRPLLTTTLAVVVLGAALPFTPLAALLGFAPLPAGYFAFLAGAVATYLALVEVVKRRVMARLLDRESRPRDHE